MEAEAAGAAGKGAAGRRPLPVGRVSMAGLAGWPGAPALQNETVNSARGQRTFPQSAPGLAPAHLSPPGNETRGRAPPPPGGPRSRATRRGERPAFAALVCETGAARSGRRRYGARGTAGAQTPLRAR